MTTTTSLESTPNGKQPEISNTTSTQKMSKTEQKQQGGDQRKPRRVYRRRGRKKSDINAIPESISQNKALLSAIASSLPSDYEFEILKTVYRIHSSKARHVALQMPEGLLMYACTIADILKKFSVDGTLEAVSILGDVTYGGMCPCVPHFEY